MRSEELLPCPFCGEESIVEQYAEDGFSVTCPNHEWHKSDAPGISIAGDIDICTRLDNGKYNYETGYIEYPREELERCRKAAIEAWNTRAERTCKFEADILITAWDEDDNEIETGEVADGADMYCGNCGYPMMRDECDGWWDEEPGPYGGWLLTPRFNYCPKCGSLVTDWDGRGVELGVSAESRPR